MNHIGRAIEK